MGIVGCVENAIRQSKDSNEVFNEKNQNSSDSIFSQVLKKICMYIVSTLESGINIQVRLSIFAVFSRGYVLIKGGYLY